MSREPNPRVRKMPLVPSGRGPLAAGLLLATLAGCAREPAAEAPARFEPNRIYAQGLARHFDQPMDEALRDTEVVLAAMFGTPDEPRLPGFVLADPDLAELLSRDRLARAAGPVADPPEMHPEVGLYRTHCASCHGVTGDGRGPAAGMQDPYPRDFRPGIFKWKSTRRGSKPTRDDLADTIRHGIPGTGMTPFSQLTDEEIASLVDYVIFLSWRGELERTMLQDAALELDLTQDRIVDPVPEPDPELETTDPEAYEEQRDAYELYQEQLEFIQDYTFDIADAWLSAEDYVVEVEQPEMVRLIDLDDPATADDPEVVESVERGWEVYLSQVAGCVQCHGKEGRGEGQVSDYDDWTKDWTQRVGLQPTDEIALLPLMVQGALPPRPILPRDFRSAQFRGGATPEDLYRRITQGIEGTPMPAATMTASPDQPGLSESDVWDLINLIYALALEGQAGPGAAAEEDAPPRQEA